MQPCQGCADGISEASVHYVLLQEEPQDLSPALLPGSAALSPPGPSLQQWGTTRLQSAPRTAPAQPARPRDCGGETWGHAAHEGLH